MGGAVTLYDYEIATEFGGIHSDELADGKPLDSWLLRAMARSSNLLATHGEPALSILYDSDLSTGDETGGSMRGVGNMFWQEIFPGAVTVTKKGGLVSFELKIIAKINGTDTIQFQIGTDATGGLSQAVSSSSPNVMSCKGDGSNAWQTFTLSGIPAAPGRFEHVSIAARGEMPETPTEADAGAYGGPSSGTIIGYNQISQGVGNLYAAAAWNIATPNIASTGHAVRFLNSSGQDAIAARTVIGVGAEHPGGSGSGTTNGLYYAPGPDFVLQARTLVGSTYQVIELPRWRLAHVGLWTEDRT